MKKVLANNYFLATLGVILMLIVSIISVYLGYACSYTNNRNFVIALIIMYSIVILLFYVCEKKDKFSFAVIAFIYLCTIHFDMLFQWISNGGKSYFYAGSIIDMFIYAIMVTVLCIIFKKLSIVLQVLTVFSCILGVFNYNLYQMRGKPACIGDLLSIKTALSVSSNYKFTIDEHVIVYMIMLIISAAILRKVVSLYQEKEKIQNSFPIKVCILSVLLISFTYCVISGLSQAMLFMTYDGYFAKNFAQLQQILTLKPKNYDIEQIKKIAEKYPEGEKHDEVENIIVILNESYSDVDHIYGLNLSKNITEIDPASGHLFQTKCYSSIFGGNTPNSEYEFLTGGSLISFPIDTVPFSTYMNDNNITSVVEQTKRLGFNNYALHPFDKVNWNRFMVYDILGFEEKNFIEDLDESSIERVRVWASDAWIYDRLYSKIVDSEEKQFLYTVTMQNHGGYTWGYDDNDIKITNGNYPQAEEFLNLMDESNKALNKLFEKLCSVDEKTIVIMLGDHQPSLEEELINNQNQELSEAGEESNLVKYEVPLIVWSNYDIGEMNIERTSINYIASLVFQQAGIPLTGYQQYLLDLYKDFPVITANGGYDSKNQFYSREELIKNEKVQEYININYNMIIDKNKVTEFYQLKQ